MNRRAQLFAQSEQGLRIRKELLKMVENDEYNTRSRYSVSHTDGMGFVEKHMAYMSQYPNLDYSQYVSNLKLITKQQGSQAGATR